MEIRNERLGIVLRDYSEQGFDYAAFSAEISEADFLTAEEKQAIIKGFSPDSFYEINYDTFKTMKNRMYFGVPEEPFTLEADHPVHAIWDEVWNNVRTRYEPEITQYKQSPAYLSLGGEAYYLNTRPAIEVDSNYPYINATMRKDSEGEGYSYTSSTSSLTLRTAFLDLEPDIQRAILYHEAGHYFAPVLTTSPRTPKNYDERKDLLNNRFLNLPQRREESWSDEMPVLFGYGEEAKSAFVQIQEQSRQQDEKAIKVDNIARGHGFKLDKKGLYTNVMHQIKKQDKDQTFDQILKEKAKDDFRELSDISKTLARDENGKLAPDRSIRGRWKALKPTHPSFAKRIKNIERNMQKWTDEIQRPSGQAHEH